MFSQLIAFLCAACIALGASSGLTTDGKQNQPDIREKVNVASANDEEKSAGTLCALFVNGEKLTAASYIVADSGETFALIPLLPVLEHMGAQTEWMTDNTANVTITGEIYVFDTLNDTFTAKDSADNLLLPAPGALHKKRIEKRDGVVFVDSDTLDLIFYFILGERISVNENELTVSVDSI